MKESLKLALSYEKCREYLEKSPQDRERILQFLKEIDGGHDKDWLRFTAGFIDKTFAKLYDGMNFIYKPESDLRSLVEKYHVILVPNHQSHADYVALQYALLKEFSMPAYIAAGINLKVFPLGSFFRRTGAFFIRRKFTDHRYKLAFEAYLFYLLSTNKMLKFFFEGGRTRSGKLLSPRYGLFSMLLEVYQNMLTKRTLCFVPVSVAHEHVPEEGAHAKELGGAKKQKESAGQLFKLFKLFDKKLGTIHIRLGDPILVDEVVNLREQTHQLAFDCFRAVGKGMPVTPMSLLSLVLLDGPSGAMTWKQIYEQAALIMSYCRHFNIIYTDSLSEERLEATLRLALNMLINNHKVDLTTNEKLHQVFYTVVEEARVNLLFHKNMVLHHFLVPGLVSSVWYHLFSGQITNSRDLTKFLLRRRKEFKYEFYLPTIKEMMAHALAILEKGVAKKLTHLEQVLELSKDDLHALADEVRPFSSAFSYIYEAYYISCVTVKFIHDDERELSFESYQEVSAELFELEKSHGKIIRYPESYNIPAMKANWKYLINQKVIVAKDDAPSQYRVVSYDELNTLIDHFSQDLNDLLAIKIKSH